MPTIANGKVSDTVTGVCRTFHRPGPFVATKPLPGPAGIDGEVSDTVPEA
jgi:hypothetical protein